MIALTVRLFGGGDIVDMNVRRLVEVDGLVFSVLPHGLTSGKPSVSLIFPIADSYYVDEPTAFVAQTTLALLATACEAAIAVHGDPRTEMPVTERREMLARAKKWVKDLEKSLKEVTYDGPGGQGTLG